MKIKASDLLRHLRAKGYTGKPEAKAILEWANAEGHELVDPENKTLDEAAIQAILNTKAAIRLTADDEPDGDDDDAEPEPKPKRKAVASKVTAINGQVAGDTGDNPRTMAIRAERKRYDARAQAFMASGRKHTHGDGHPKFTNSDDAACFGAACRLAIAGEKAYPERSNDLDLVGKVLLTNNSTIGGSFVPEQFLPDLISLKEQYGVARSLVRNVTMSSDTLRVPRRTSGLTVYLPGEGNAGTQSTPGTDSVELTAKELMTLVSCSRQWFSDSAISAGDFIAEEIAWAFANAEDEAIFNGDGTSTYWGYTGLRTSLYGGALGTTVANIAGLHAGTAPGAAYSSNTLNDYLATAGKLPAYVKNPVWVMHKSTFFNGPATKNLAAGGVTRTETEDGPRYMLVGYPVVFSQVMPRVAATNQVFALLGEFSLAAMLGEVRGLEIAMSEHVGFTSNTIYFRGTQRTAINVHSPGNASATAADRVPGPYVGIISASS